MNRLVVELQRLHFLADQQALPDSADAAPLALQLVDGDGMVRCAVLETARTQDWPSVNALAQAVVEELGLPAPAIAVTARAGFQVWFSFAENVAQADAQAFLDGLRRKYLADLPADRIRCYPAAGCVDLPPALDGAAERWSAFIDPTMGSMFVDEAGLDLPPNPDRQADLLAGVESIRPGDFQRALKELHTPPATGEGLSGAVPVNPESAARQGGLSVGSGFDDPQQFLLAVMNDTQTAAVHRIEAAKALLPYFAKRD